MANDRHRLRRVSGPDLHRGGRFGERRGVLHQLGKQVNQRPDGSGTDPGCAGHLDLDAAVVTHLALGAAQHIQERGGMAPAALGLATAQDDQVLLVAPEAGS